MASATEKRYSVNGTMLNVREQGAGETAFVFLHYYGGSSRTWRGVMDGLAEQVRCLAVDLRGWGASDAPPSGYAVDDMADDVAALISALDLEHYIVVGHSMGGKAALALAARRPRGLRSLALLAPSPPTPEPMTDIARQGLRDAYGSQDAARDTLLTISALSLPPEAVTQALADYRRASRTAWLAWLETGSREDISKRMVQITVPVAVLVGSADPVISAEVLQREIVNKVTGAQMTVIPGAGHLLPVEATAAVIEFLLQTASQTIPRP